MDSNLELLYIAFGVLMAVLFVAVFGLYVAERLIDRAKNKLRKSRGYQELVLENPDVILHVKDGEVLLGGIAKGDDMEALVSESATALDGDERKE